MSLGEELPANVTAFPEAITNDEAELQTGVLTSLFCKDKDRGEKRAICILHNQKWRETAERVQNFYTVGRRIESHLVSYDETKWLDAVRVLKCSHYLFFGMPQYERSRRSLLRPRTPRSPIESNSAEAEFFTPSPYGAGHLKVNNVVVVLWDMPQTMKDRNKMSGHYLEKYLKLSGNKPHSVIAASALGVFSGKRWSWLEDSLQKLVQPLVCVHRCVHVRVRYSRSCFKEEAWKPFEDVCVLGVKIFAFDFVHW